jgi:hypothetical protein
MPKRKKSKRPENGRYALWAFRSLWTRVLFAVAIGVVSGALIAGGSIVAGVIAGLFMTAFSYMLIVILNASHYAEITKEGLLVAMPRTHESPAVNHAIPYDSIVAIERKGASLKIKYHAEPLVGESAVHHTLSIRPQEIERLESHLRQRTGDVTHDSDVDAMAANRMRTALQAVWPMLGVFALSVIVGVVSAQC